MGKSNAHKDNRGGAVRSHLCKLILTSWGKGCAGKKTAAKSVRKEKQAKLVFSPYWFRSQHSNELKIENSATEMLKAIVTVIFTLVLYLTSILKPNYTLFLKTKGNKTNIILQNNKSGCWKAV